MSTSTEKNNVHHTNESLQHFDWPDYGVFVLMLAGSSAIGIYFGFVQKKTKNKLVRNEHESEAAKEYLMGGGQLSVIPVATSLVARYMFSMPISKLR